MVTYIYCLFDPRDNLPKYIGKSDNPERRLLDHNHTNTNKSNTAKNQWIKKLHILGLKPYMDILDEVLISEWEFWEKYYISLYKSWNFKLKNCSSGGLGSYKPNGEALNKGTKYGPISEERKKNISEGTKKAMNTPEIKAKTREGNKIMHSKIFKNGKLRPDIIESIREGSKKKVYVYNENILINEFNSVELFQTYYNISNNPKQIPTSEKIGRHYKIELGGIDYVKSRQKPRKNKK